MTPLHAKSFAFIDAQNLHLGVKGQGWLLDFARFRRYLRDKFGVERAYLFIGFKRGNEGLYTHLERSGYLCVFKPTLVLKDGQIKGNVDAELVLHSMIEFPNYAKAVIVTGDGDFRCLVEYLLRQGKLERLIIPNQKRYSALLKSLSTPDRNIFVFLNQFREKLGTNEKGSRRDGTLGEPLSS
ncbi:MAG: hypothetical protein RLZZ324_784 [Candidatus Parcubacteria bacterium]|jgi:uncharacterized LabA/DUF88 family protein